MKVRTAFSFDEKTLRTIRATYGRGGVANRKECVIFINRAVEAALKDAPDPKPARKRRSKADPVEEKEVEPTVPADDTDAARATRDRIRKLYCRD